MLGQSSVFPVFIGDYFNDAFNVVSSLYDKEPVLVWTWGWVLNFLSNVGITEATPSCFINFINYVSLGEGIYLARYELMTVPEYDNLFHVCHK